MPRRARGSRCRFAHLQRGRDRSGRPHRIDAAHRTGKLAPEAAAAEAAATEAIAEAAAAEAIAPAAAAAAEAARAAS